MSTIDPVYGSFFSVSFDLVIVNEKIPYDLFVNSSILESKEKFVRIFPSGERLGSADLQRFKEKYHQLYVAETQRSLYLKSLCSAKGRTDEEKTAVLKDSAIHYLQSLFDSNKEFSTEVLTQAIEGCRDVVENMVDMLQDYSIDDLKDLIGNLSFHDFYTYDHSINVSMYAVLIYRTIRPEATRNEVVLAGLGGLMHDLGKIKIPTSILNNSGKLTDDEFALIKRHPDYGLGLLSDSQIKVPAEIDLRVLGRIVHEHHENFDGTGYPDKLAGERIHILARVTAIADFFDAVTTKRSYHEPMSIEEALALMSRSVGKKIDPAIFEIFSKHAVAFQAKTKRKIELPSDFDPCQPHAELPLIHLPNDELICAESEGEKKLRVLAKYRQHQQKPEPSKAVPIKAKVMKKFSTGAVIKRRRTG